jgi:hypothetical protein
VSVDDERLQLLGSIGRQGKDRATLVAELGDAFDVDAALDRALGAFDLREQVTLLYAETGLPPERELVVYTLTEQGARKVGIDPNTVPYL